jgi:hypothetical protein
MDRSGFSLVMKEASLIDVEEIKADLPASDLEVVQPTSDAETHNELVTILVLALTPMALAAVSMWLLRKHDSEIIDYVVTIRNPDGSETDVHLNIKRSSSEAPKEQIIKQIAAALKVPEHTILAAST